MKSTAGLGTSNQLPSPDIAWGDRQATDEEIVATTAAEKRLIVEITIHRAYGRLAA